MKIQIAAVLGALATSWFFLKKWTDRISKIIEPVIIEKERLALDGEIDKYDRKKLVMLAISKFEEDGILKLNFITRWAISKLVDRIAEKLMSFEEARVKRQLERIKNEEKK